MWRLLVFVKLGLSNPAELAEIAALAVRRVIPAGRRTDSAPMVGAGGEMFELRALCRGSPRRATIAPTGAGMAQRSRRRRATGLWYGLLTDFPHRLPSPNIDRGEPNMPVDDRTRLNLHRKLDDVLGREEADTLMAHLPPVTWNEVATKDDLHRVETTLRSEMRVGFADLRTEMAGLRTEMADGRTEIADAMTRQIKWFVTFAAAWSSVLVAAVRIMP
jgi:hypothetical protein